MITSKVKIYSTPTCPYCAQAKKYLEEREVPFENIDVSADQQARDEMIRKSGQMGVPVIIVGKEVIVGFNRPQLEQLFNSQTL